MKPRGGKHNGGIKTLPTTHGPPPLNFAFKVAEWTCTKSLSELRSKLHDFIKKVPCVFFFFVVWRFWWGGFGWPNWVTLFLVMFNGDVIWEVSGPPVSINQSYHFQKKTAHLGGSFNFFLFSSLFGGRFPIWVTFSKWVETTNQTSIQRQLHGWPCRVYQYPQDWSNVPWRVGYNYRRSKVQAAPLVQGTVPSRKAKVTQVGRVHVLFSVVNWFSERKTLGKIVWNGQSVVVRINEISIDFPLGTWKHAFFCQKPLDFCMITLPETNKSLWK